MDIGAVITSAKSEKAAFAVNDEPIRQDITNARLEAHFSIHGAKPLLDDKLISLLFFIEQTQSVREACHRIQISYSSAWKMLNSAEEALAYPLIIRNRGGASGTGSVLTNKGKLLLDACLAFDTAAKESLEKLFNQYIKNIL